MTEKVTGKKHFISTLGTSFYERTEYVSGKGKYETKFVQEASLMMEVGADNVDKISICLTPRAEETNWISRPYTEEEIERESKKHPELNISKDTYYEGLGEILNRKFPGKINTVRMSDGNTQDDMDKMFEELYSVIEEGDEVYFDITHGLRHLPMLVLVVLAYAKATKNITVGGIYYGMLSWERNENNIMKGTLMDLTYYSDILSWSNAADAFIRYGDCKQINDLLSGFLAGEWKEHGASARQKYGNIRNLVNALNNITQCVETGRGRYEKDEKASIQYAYEKYYDMYQKADLALADNYKPLGLLFDKMHKKISIFNKNDNLEIGLATVQWSIDNDMVQQGYTALAESIKTYACNIAGVDDSNRLYRENFSKAIINKIDQLMRAKGKTYSREDWFAAWLTEMEEDAGRRFTAFYDGVPKEGQETKKNEIIECAKNFIDRLPVEIVLISQSVTEKRNNINHFGFSSGMCKSDNFMKSLKEDYRKFVQVVRKDSKKTEMKD